MSELTDKLRQMAEDCDWIGREASADLARDAADELDRLEAIETEYNDCREEVVTIASRESAMVEQLRAERNLFLAERQQLRGLLPACLEENVPTLIEAVERLTRERDEARVIIERLDRLREDRCKSITFTASNSFYNSEPDERVEIVAEWTDWKPVVFTGATIADCLAAAEAARHA